MSTITPILRKFGLLDSEDYLVPPEDHHVYDLVQKMVKLRSIIEDGKKLTPIQKADLADMEAAKDYYDEAIEDELNNLEGAEGDEDEDEDEFEDEEEEPETPTDVTTAVADIDLEEVEDEEEDKSYEE